MNITYTSELVEKERQRQIPLAKAIESGFSDGVVIYGAGFVGTWASDYLNSMGAKVLKFIDRDEHKHGIGKNGIPVVGPSPQEFRDVPAMFIAARHAIRSVMEIVGPYDLTAISFDGYFVLRNYERLVRIRENYLSDSRSIEVFNALLMSMLTGDTSPCRDVMEKDMYFCLPEFSGNFEETFVDAGAFVGDTVERFIWENLGTFRHLHAFEPGYKQFQALERRTERLMMEWGINTDAISLVRAGLGDVTGRMACTYLDDFPLRHGLSNMEPNATTGKEDRQNAPVMTLDDYLDGKPVSFLKADVEGMEMELLRGAEKTIRTFRPKMALCVYHYPSHLYEIAEFVRGLIPEYKFSLRQHAPIFGDFVLYCYTEQNN
uniref:Methyltransferase, FkbM family n=1 Tax=Candidatus Kentrum sp. MB TaxID=2138164 RepID=A0A450XGT5_9GAMM|nr:MAG: methyltransferase, FkbM family [Candidatus Kentron sp. MB]VFK28454.1 MAG: methyltransferase, FkbM family [Candidatus Kentron sp. MB]VFK74260.1 MAG: methyltransferase, FkbM family [Candidatus Kentron sp. MB]